MNFYFTRINHVHRHCQSQGTKSDIVRCLEDAAEEQDDTSVDVVVVLDGLAILYMLKPASARTFCESYVHDVFLPYVGVTSTG